MNNRQMTAAAAQLLLDAPAIEAQVVRNRTAVRHAPAAKHGLAHTIKNPTPSF